MLLWCISIKNTSNMTYQSFTLIDQLDLWNKQIHKTDEVIYTCYHSCCILYRRSIYLNVLFGQLILALIIHYDLSFDVIWNSVCNRFNMYNFVMLPPLYTIHCISFRKYTRRKQWFLSSLALQWIRSSLTCCSRRGRIHYQYLLPLQ